MRKTQGIYQKTNFKIDTNLIATGVNLSSLNFPRKNYITLVL